MSGLWFRIYDEALDDPRLQRLPASLFRVWFNLLCAASRNGGTLPDLPELAFMLRTRPGALSRRLEALKAAGLIEEMDGALRPREWDKRQFVERPADPTAADRMRRMRERAVERNGAMAPTVTNATVEGEEEKDTDTQTVPAARENELDAFGEFWRAFPRRDGDNAKKPALEAFQKAIAAGVRPGAHHRRGQSLRQRRGGSGTAIHRQRGPLAIRGALERRYALARERRAHGRRWRLDFKHVARMDCLGGPLAHDQGKEPADRRKQRLALPYETSPLTARKRGVITK